MPDNLILPGIPELFVVILMVALVLSPAALKWVWRCIRRN